MKETWLSQRGQLQTRPPIPTPPVTVETTPSRFSSTPDGADLQGRALAGPLAKRHEQRRWGAGP